MDTALLDQRHTELVDRVESLLVSNFPKVECPSIHRFAKGCYCRETFLPAQTGLTSKIHKTQHFYVILEGTGQVWNKGVATPYQAGTIGITEAGTRRIIETFTDTRWATFHVHDSQDLDEIEDDIIQKHTNPLLDELNIKELQ